MSEHDWLHTDIGAVDADSITVRGLDLANDLMGKVTFTELTYLLVRGRAPTPQETVLLDAVLVSLAEHGLTPTVLAARLTHTGAPESLQGAVASGLLGAGTVFLGVVEDTAVFLEPIVAAGDDDLARAAADAVRARIAAGGRIPGIGHPIHKAEDPRTARIYAIASEQGLEGPHLRALRHVADAHREATGKALPINGAGVAGAALADLGFPARIVRGMALLARTAGLVAHLDEEMSRPLGMPLFLDVERRTQEQLAHVERRVAGLLVGGKRGGGRLDAVVALVAIEVRPHHPGHVPRPEEVVRVRDPAGLGGGVGRILGAADLADEEPVPMVRRELVGGGEDLLHAAPVAGAVVAVDADQVDLPGQELRGLRRVVVDVARSDDPHPARRS